MKILVIKIIALSSWFFASSALAEQLESTDYERLDKTCSDNTFLIISKPVNKNTPNEENASREVFGSSVLVDKKRFSVVTAYHVVQSAGVISLIDPISSNEINMSIDKYHRDTNLALLIPASPIDLSLAKELIHVRNLSKAKISPELVEQHTAIMCSFPYGNKQLSRKFVKATRVNIGHNKRLGFDYMISINSKAHPGESGGGIFDANGNLLGIVMAISSKQNQSPIYPAIAVPSIGVSNLMHAKR